MIARMIQRFGLGRDRVVPMRAGPKPSFEISEMEDAYRVCAEYPGVRKEDVRVTFEGSVMTVEAQRRKLENGAAGMPLRSEFSYGPSIRRFAIPRDVDSKSADASLEDGVLTLTVSKSETNGVETTREVPIR